MIMQILLAAGVALAVSAWGALVRDLSGFMGHAQRILYLHVPVAWASLLCMVMMAGTGLLYLRRRNLAWDHWSRSRPKVSEVARSFVFLNLK